MKLLRDYLRMIFGVCFIMLIILMPLLIPEHWFSLVRLQEMASALYAWAHRYQLVSMLLYLVCFIGAAQLNIPATVALSLLGGYLYGPWWGMVLAVVGAMVGNFLEFLFIRFLYPAAKRAHAGAWLSLVNAQVRHYGFWYFLMLELLPFTPMPAITIAAALSPLSARDFLLTQFFGLIPGTLVYTIAGNELHEIKKIEDILSWPMIIGLCVLAGLACIPIVFQRWGMHKLPTHVRRRA